MDQVFININVNFVNIYKDFFLVRKKGIVKIIFQYFLDHLKKESEKKIKVKTKLGKEGLGLDSEIIRTPHIR